MGLLGEGRGRVWKVLGVAGLAGVAATGVVVARDHRRRTQMSPEEVRDRLRERLAAAEAGRGGVGLPRVARPTDPPSPRPGTG